MSGDIIGRRVTGFALVDEEGWALIRTPATWSGAYGALPHVFPSALDAARWVNQSAVKGKKISVVAVEVTYVEVIGERVSNSNINED